MKIVLCLLFYNEADMLYYHLMLMYPLVDHIIIAESTHTFRGNPKESTYLLNRERYAPFADKLLHVTLDTTPHRDAWENEKAQRLIFGPVLDTLQLGDTDVVAMLDVDEVLNPVYVHALRQRGLPSQHASWHVPLDMYFYNFQNRIAPKWRFPALATFPEFQKLNGNALRWQILGGRPVPELDLSGLGVEGNVPNGWHMAYWGDVAWIQNKLRQFSHAEIDTPAINDATQIQAHIDAGTNFFDGTPFVREVVKYHPRLPPPIRLETGAWFPYTPT